MISYEPFWKTLKDKGVSTYTLREKHSISSETLHRLKHNKAVTTTKIDDLCGVLDCGVGDIMKYVKQER
jgi:DNA-binding Xre family transcriptional regulator